MAVVPNHADRLRDQIAAARSTIASSYFGLWSASGQSAGGRKPIIPMTKAAPLPMMHT